MKLLSFFLVFLISYSTFAEMHSSNEAEKEFQTNAPVDKEVIRKSILSNLKDIRKCYIAVLKKNPKLQGKVVMKWTITKEGKVSGAEVKNSEIKSNWLGQCMAHKILKWKFSPLPDYNNVIVSFPFLLAVDK